jgi:hypothetical protein
MSIGFLVTMTLLTIALWVLLQLVRRHAPRVRAKRRTPLVLRAPPAETLSGAERRRLYRRLGLDPATLRHAPPRGGLRVRLAAPRRSDVDGPISSRGPFGP